MKGTLKQKAEVIFSDFFTRCKFGNLACKGIRKTLHYSQGTMAQKIHYSQNTLANFENDVLMNPDTICNIYKSFCKINYEIYTSLSEKDYILYCLRAVSNYGTVLHEEGEDDEETIKKYIKIFSDLYADAG